MKSLDQKLTEIRANRSSRAFIITDAKDAEMAFGAPAALFDRKIDDAEYQLAFIEMLRLITDGKLSPEEAVRAYHGVLQGKGIKPHRALDEDLKPRDQAMICDGSAARRATVEICNNPLESAKPSPPMADAGRSASASGSPQAGGWPKLGNGEPDFDSSSSLTV